jgi:hypothetical protein
MLEDKSSSNESDWKKEDGSAVEGSETVPLDCHGVSVIGKGRRVNQDDYLRAARRPAGTAEGRPFFSRWPTAPARAAGTAPARW